jgi:hypothetical protein
MKTVKINLAILLLSVIALTSFVSAVGDIGLVKQNECIELYNYCPTCSYINLTLIQFPDGSISNMNEAMTKSNKDYNYSFCNTTMLGAYSYTTCGDKAGEETCEDISFESTPSGRGGTSNIAFMIILIVYRNITLSALTGMLMIFLGIWIVRNGVVIYRDNLTNYFGYVTIFIGAAIALTALIEWIQNVL